MDITRIKYERTGGFAGIRIATDFKLEELPKEQARQLLELLDEVDFNELPERLMDEEGMADGFTYSITVESKVRKHTVVTSNASTPEKMEELVELLYQIARQRARKPGVKR